MGDQIKPEGGVKPEKKVKPEEEGEPKAVRRERPRRVVPKEVKVEEKALTLEARQMVHSKQTEVGQPVLFVVAAGPAKGAVVVGKVIEIQKMEKDEPGRVKIALDSVSSGGGSTPLSGTIQVQREKGKDELGGKEVFMLVGYKQPVPVPKKLSLKAPPPPMKAAKKGKVQGPILASASVEDGPISVKVGALKYPNKLNVYLEPPGSLKLADINEESIRLIRVNEVSLPRPVGPTPDKIKVADTNKNNVQELGYKFDGWEVIQYLPEGSSNLVFSATTKDGKPIEASTRVTVEYR